jgi:hypothetical protein
MRRSSPFTAADLLVCRKMREELGKLRCGMQTYEENITTLARDARDAFEVLIIALSSSLGKMDSIRGHLMLIEDLFRA